MRSVILLHDPPHTATLHASLCNTGYTVLAELDAPQALHHEVQRLAPQVIIVVTESPGEMLFASLRQVAGSCPRPIVMFAKDAARDVIRKAVDCGVGAYVVDGWAPERLTPIIEAASARFEAFESMKHELAKTRAKLSERKLIERAKGIVMAQRRLSEDEAYGALRKMAMNQNLALAEVARRVIAVAQLLA